jgi:hypothetical protein
MRVRICLGTVMAHSDGAVDVAYVDDPARLSGSSVSAQVLLLFRIYMYNQNAYII